MKKFITKTERRKWVDNFVKNYNGISISGENNPMFGMHHSKETKDKIGEQTIRYMSDPLVKKKHSESIKAFWKSDNALKIKEKYAKLRSLEKQIRDNKLDKKDPLKKRKCVICGFLFLCRKSDLRKTCKSRKGCSQIYAWKIGISKYGGDGQRSYKTKMLNYSKKVGLVEEDSFNSFYKKVLEAKRNSLIPKNFSMREPVINKYFGCFDTLKTESKNG